MTEILNNISYFITSGQILRAEFWVSSGRNSFYEVLWFLILSVALGAVGVLFFIYLRFFVRDNPPKQRLFTPFSWGLIVIGVLGLIFGLFRIEGVTFFSAFAFWAVIGLGTIAWVGYFIFRYFKYLPAEFASYESKLLKQKYLPKRKKRS